MKKYLYLCLATAFIFGCSEVGEVDDLLKQVEEIATLKSQIDGIQTSLADIQRVDEELKGYIKTLQDNLASVDDNYSEVQKQLIALTDADQALEKKIKELKDYCDQKDKDLRDWVSQTYTTLEQHSAVLKEIAEIKLRIETLENSLTELDASLSQKIADSEARVMAALDQTEESLKGWVNEQLAGYYTIAQIDAQLKLLEDAYKSADETMAGDIQKLREDLEKATASLTAAYQEAIAAAIENNNGVINEKIAADIKAASDALQAQINAITARLDSLEARVDNLEATTQALLARIQSLSYIPRYKDGASTMWIKVLADGSLDARDTLDFRVSPADCVADLVSVWKTALSVEAVTVQTRAPGDDVKIPVVSVTGADGKLSVVLDGGSLGESFVSSVSQLDAVLVVSDGNNERTSEYVGIVPVWKEFNAPYAVDLGLSVKWAMCNVGARTPEEDGDRYVWGDTEPGYQELEQYKWYSGGVYTKYNVDANYGTVDYKTVLETGPEGDDVASKLYGGNWRMPTKEEWKELIQNCNCTEGLRNGVRGLYVTGPNGASIFLPEAYSEGYSCNYWSSSLGTDYSWSDSSNYAFTIALTLGYEAGSVRCHSYSRCWAWFVRPVYGEIVPITGMEMNKTHHSMDIGSEEQLSVIVSPSNATYNYYYWYSSDPTIATVSQDGLVTGVSNGEATITAVSVDGLYSTSCVFTVTMPVPELVDLGLNVKWASFNLGAHVPEAYGLYYSWGETEPKSDYIDATYRWGNDYGLTKYCPSDMIGYWGGTNTPDDCTEFSQYEYADDAARQSLGESWRVPTEDDWIELTEKCNWTWSEMNGVSGFLVTGPNSNSIFLPITGIMSGTEYKMWSEWGEREGYYWSSSIYRSEPAYASSMMLREEPVKYRVVSIHRVYGLSIRPVYDDSVLLQEVTLDKNALTLSFGESVQLTATITPSEVMNKRVTWKSSNPDVVTVNEDGVVRAISSGTATITVKTVAMGRTASCDVTVEPFVPEPVDLGLSVRWASANLNDSGFVSNPMERGSDYGWGETSVKTDMGWSAYPLCAGSARTMTKYCTQSYYGTVDNLTVLEASDDVAYQLLKGHWRMPTDAEWAELRNDCTWTFTSDGGHEGFWVTASNGNSIYLPVSSYWSSSLYTAVPSQAISIRLENNYVKISDKVYRFYGGVIRPVCD